MPATTARKLSIMVIRYLGACLGLLAFAIVVIAGIAIGNPPMLTLSRAVWALAVFCLLGLLVGACAQAIVNEHNRQREQIEIPSVESQKDAGDTESNTEGALDQSHAPKEAEETVELGS